MKRSVGVEIAGQRYAIRSDADEEYVNALARYVDEKIADARRSTRTVSTHQVVILAALTIADELFREQGSHAEMKQKIRERVHRALERLEQEAKAPGYA
ncbi:MAG TPA: cell division protein ZapA [Polyangia bacterium]